ncbi:MAG: MFS transporter [Planctomycetaceae bacterium]|nr:MFS transporter [Planctomycetaceae bacterium]
MEQPLPWIQRFELMAMLFLHGMALAAWFVPMGTVLQACGLGAWTPFAFGASAVAALLSPLFFGAMADRSVPPIQVLRWVSIGAGLLSLVTAFALKQQLGGLSIWLLIQLQALLSVPTNSLSGSIVLARVANAHGQFGAIRAMGTAGWMAGCWIVSGLELDASENTFALSGFLWFVLAAYTLLLPAGVVQSSTSGRLTLRQRFGLDALSLLKEHDHRVIFITAALVAIPFAAFYPYTPMHMKDLGMLRTSAWMSLGQVIEVVIMFAIGSVMVEWKLKRVILVGLSTGLLRYFFYAMDGQIPLLLGVGLHGLAYTFTYISTQIYLAKRIAPQWRTRAQALLSLLVGGIGNLTGYLVTGTWLAICTSGSDVNWQQYWIGLSLLVFAVLIYFAMNYQGEKVPQVATDPANTA